MEKPKKKLYFLTLSPKNNSIDKLEWAEGIYQKEQHYVFNSDFKVFKAKEIYEYASRFDSTNEPNIIGKCIILDNSSKYDNKVMICPIYPKSVSDNKFGINIGKIYGINDYEEFIAALSEIRFVSKRRFQLKNKLISQASSLCNLSTSAYLNILESYKKIMESIINKTTSFNQNLLINNKIYSA